MTFLESYYLLLITLWCGLYLIFYLLYRRSIISLSDPINIGAALLAAYLAGALLILWVMPVNRSYIDLIILIFIYIGVGSIFSRSRQPASVPHLIMEPTTQLLFTIALAGLTIINLFLNEIPRLSYGFRVNAAVALPSLSLIAPDLSFLLLLLFLLSEVMQVRRIAGVGLAFVFLGSLISGSKLGLFSIVFALFVADYILHLKIKSYQLSSNQLLTLKRKIKRIRKAATLCALGAVVALPAYLVMIGVISGAEFGSAISTMTARTFGGFDAIAIVASRDVDLLSPSGINISDFYFYPFIKTLSHTPEFQSAGVYLIYQMTGNYEYAQSGLNPNSTYAIELLLSNNSLAVSIFVIALTAALIFRIRAAVIRRGKLRMIDLILWDLIVYGPFSMLLDGSYFVIRTYLLIILYVTLMLLVTTIAWLKPGKKKFNLL